MKRPLWACLVAILLCLTAAACSSRTVQPSTPSGTPKRPTTTKKVSTPNATPVVSTPQLGIDVLWYYDGSDTNATIVAKAEQTFNYVESLGGNAVAISFPFYMTGPKADAVIGESPTPTPDQLALVVQQAKHLNLRVTLRPLLDEATLHSGWRGSIEPENRAEWFASYKTFLQPYLTMAQANGVNQFEVGSELNSLSADASWTDLVQWAKSLYDGVLGFSNNWDFFHDGKLGATNAVDAEGVDTYFPVDLPDNASVSQLVAAWNTWLNTVPTSVDLTKTTITEVGIPAQSGAYHEPSDWGSYGAAIMPEIQQNWFTAACIAMKEHNMQGIYFWRLDLSQPPGSFNPSTATQTSFVGRGDTAIKTCFEG